MLNQADSKLAVVERSSPSRKPSSSSASPGPPRSPTAPPGCWPAGSPPTGRSPSRSRSGSATAPAARCTTPTATSTWTCTAATAPPSPATPTRPSSARSRRRWSGAPTSRSRPRTRSPSPASWPAAGGCRSWRFANSGTEATMDAVHLMRSFTGRDLIIKVEGGYHGHHDSVQVSVMPDADEAGPRDKPEPGPVVNRHPRRDHPPHAGRPVQRPRQRRQAPARRTRPGRGHDRRARDDERRHHPPAARLPGGPARTCSTTTARC